MPGNGWQQQPGGDAALTAPMPGMQLQLEQMPAAPVTQQSVQKAAPPPSNRARSGSSGSAYGQLPLSISDAKQKIVELKNLVLMTRPQEIQDRVSQLSEWLADIADAHNKMANTFAKHDATKAQSLSERQAACTFGQLKREAELIKAEVLINQRRYPEALAPLVDIVVAEPTSATGRDAYQKLKDLGFSQESSLSPVAASVETPSAVAKPKNVNDVKRISFERANYQSF